MKHQRYRLWKIRISIIFDEEYINLMIPKLCKIEKSLVFLSLALLCNKISGAIIKLHNSLARLLIEKYLF